MSILQLTQTIQLLPHLPVRRRKQNPKQAMLPGMEPETPQVSNRQIAEVLAGVADMLEARRDNPYRVQAYRNAARGILDLQEPVANILQRGELLEVPGLGRRLRERIRELVASGSMTIQNGFNMDNIPADARQFLHLKNVGPYTVLRLYEEGIDSWEKLQQAVKEHRIREFDGFGKRSEARLQHAVESYIRPGGAA